VITTSEEIDCPYCPYANPPDEVYVHLLAEHCDELSDGWRDVVEAIDLFDAIEPEATTDRGTAAALVEDLDQLASSAEEEAETAEDQVDVARAQARARAFQVARDEVRVRILEQRGGA